MTIFTRTKVGNIRVRTLRAPIDELCAIFEEFLWDILEVL